MAATNRIYITGYRDCAHDAAGNPLQCGEEPAAFEGYLDISGQSVALSDPLPDVVKFISIYADSDCHIAIDEDPEATQDAKKLGGGSTMFCGLSRSGLKVAVIEEAQDEEGGGG